MRKIEYTIDEFMNYCESKNLSQKTMMSYEQTLRLFSKYIQEEKNIEDVIKITEKDIRDYVVYIYNRGKYTVVIDKKTLKGNIFEARGDYGKQVSITTVNNYIRNIKVFFNYCKEQGIIKKEVVKNIKQFKNERKSKQFITDGEFGELLRHIDTTKFHEYRDYICVLFCSTKGNIVMMRTFEKKLKDYG
ncbi:tyrosine-type recombinase/integrase [Clostridium estertheticum]|uniref:tyrosine-type recombinase/integrase n=1 Tax=Clostridium estertheticum TaxID=238834 RepID=UPI00209ACB55|nr:site-specific integrase [Clostridium estertheticum]